MSLWIAAAVLVAGTLAMVLAPLLRRAPAALLHARDYDIEVYRDQLAELERDRERGVIGSSESEAARVEIERRLLAAAETEGTPAKAGATAAGPRRITAAVLALLIAAGAVALYLETGRPDLPGQPFAVREARDAQIAAAQRAEAEARIAALEGRLEASPDDLAGWIELARAYRSIERFADAARAFGRARAIVGDEPIILSAYGEALTMAAGGRVTPDAKAAFDAVLARQSGNPRARFYLGLARAQAGDAAGALDIWIALEAASPPNSPWRANLGRQMQALAAEAGIDLAARRRDLAGASANAPGPGRADLEAARSMSPEQRTAMIRSMVARLAARLEESPNDAAGWKRLGRSYRVLGESENAERAFARARAIESGGAQADTQDRDAAPGAGQQAMIRSMVERLAARLEESPDDLAGWKQLGRSYAVLGQPEKAAEAYAKAAALAPGDVDLLVDYGEALLGAHRAGAPLPLGFVAVMRDILVLEPGNALALWYVGLGEAQAGRPKQAAAHWRALLERMPAGAPERAKVEKRIRALGLPQ